MKVECIKEKLGSAIYRIEKVAGKNPTLPVLSCVLLVAKDSTLTLRATNLDLGIEVRIPAKVEKGGVVAIPAGPLHSFVLAPSGGSGIKLLGDGDNLVLTTGSSKAILRGFNHDDFPTIPAPPTEKPFHLSPTDLTNGLKSVWYSSATSSMKPELSSVFVHTDGDTFVFAATDSFRLAEKRIKLKKIKDTPSFLIPFKNAAEIVRMLEGETEDLVANMTKNQLSLSFDGGYITSRVIDGTFPDYKQIIPKDFTSEVITLKEDFGNALRLANVFSDTLNQVNLKISPKDKTFMVSTKNSNLGENTTRVEATINGDEIDSNFNYKYIVDCLASIDADSISLGFAGANRPLVIRGVSDRSFTYLVMPMNK